ncbi:hypothetical protein J6590_092359 [Homalodisca vitripennis]|nr:hypothetical protein J6590_092359 [Homalodisca vitripennis]
MLGRPNFLKLYFSNILTSVSSVTSIVDAKLYNAVDILETLSSLVFANRDTYTKCILLKRVRSHIKARVWLSNFTYIDKVTNV